MASEGYKWEDGDAVNLDYDIMRLHWGLARQPRPAPPLMATGFVALATRRALPLPLPARPVFGGSIPKAAPWGPPVPAESAPPHGFPQAPESTTTSGCRRRRLASAPPGAGDPGDQEGPSP